MNCPTCGRPMPEDGGEGNFDQIADALRKRGFDADVHASGGGIDVIRLVQGEHIFYFGTSAEQWGASVYDASDENYLGEAWTQASSDEKNPAVVADAISQAATEYER